VASSLSFPSKFQAETKLCNPKETEDCPCPLHELLIRNIDQYLYNVQTDYSPKPPSEVNWHQLDMNLASGFTFYDFSGFSQQRGAWTSYKQYWEALSSTGNTLNSPPRADAYACQLSENYYVEQWTETYTYQTCVANYSSLGMYSYEFTSDGKLLTAWYNQDSYGYAEWYSMVTKSNCGIECEQNFTPYGSVYGLHPRNEVCLSCQKGANAVSEDFHTISKYPTQGKEENKECILKM